MFKCLDCGHEFETPKEDTAIHYEVDECDRELFGVCPACGSSDYELMETCKICGVPIKSSEDICQACTDTITDGLNLALGNIKTKLDCDPKVLLEVIENWVASLY